MKKACVIGHFGFGENLLNGQTIKTKNVTQELEKHFCEELILKIDTKTLYNWRKNKPELYRLIMLGFKFDELLKQSEKNLNELKDLAEENQNFRLK